MKKRIKKAIVLLICMALLVGESSISVFAEEGQPDDIAGDLVVECVSEDDTPAEEPCSEEELMTEEKSTETDAESADETVMDVTAAADSDDSTELVSTEEMSEEIALQDVDYSFEYKVLEDGSSIRITSCGGNLTGAITIPKSIDGYTVTDLESSLFAHKTEITSVTIPDTVTSISYYLFWGCSGLTSITIPDSVTIIKKGAFCDCSGLTGITIPASVTTVEDYAFDGCSGIENLAIPDTITSMGEYVFKNCTGLKSVSLPDSKTKIEAYMFSGCSGLESVTLPTSLITIESHAFYGCSGLTEVSFPASLTTIGENAFRLCSGLTGIRIPSTVKKVSSLAFAGCSSAEYVYNFSRSAVTLPSSRTWKNLATGKAIIVIANGMAVPFEQIDNPKEPVEPDAFEGFWIKLMDNPDTLDGKYYYTGKAIKPEVKVYDGNKELVLNKDYSYSVKNNTNAGVGIVTITGKGNYDKVDYLHFEIKPRDITSDEFMADGFVFKATGKDQKPKPVLKWNGRNVPSSGYTYTYHKIDSEGKINKDSIQSVSAPGSYALCINGKGNFTGSRTVGIRISDDVKDASKLTIEKIANQTYTGEKIEPELKVWDGRTPLTEGTHYTVEYKNQTAVGTATAIVTGKGEYVGVKRITYNITGTPLSKATFDGLPKTVVYKGCEYKVQDFSELKVYIKANEKTGTEQINLTENNDYKVSYLKNKDVGTATVVFTGINGYTGQVKKTFKIAQFKTAEDTEDRLSVNVASSVEYVKGGAKPTVTVTFKNADNSVSTLMEKTDYTVSYTNNTAVNDGSNSSKLPTAKIILKGNYNGTVSANFVITAKELSDTVASAADKTYANKAGAYKSVVTLTDVDGKKLAAGKDYDANVTYILKGATESDPDTELDSKSIVDAGSTIMVVIKEKENGNYTGTTTCEYRVTQAAISSANIKLVNKIYTGNTIVIDPSADIISAKIGGKTDLIYGTDYKIISYSNNTNKGTASVMIQGIGNYGGTKKLTFTIKARGFGWWWR